MLPLVGARRKEGSIARKVAKRVARRKLRRNNDKGSVPRKKDEDAAAAAEFFVYEGGRKPVEFRRRCAKVACVRSHFGSRRY